MLRQPSSAALHYYKHPDSSLTRLMGLGSFVLVTQAIGTVAVGFELFFDLAGESWRRIVSIAQLYTGSSHTSMETKRCIVKAVAFLEHPIDIG